MPAIFLMLKRIIIILFAAAISSAGLLAEGFIPTVHGTFRADYELSTDNGDSRFQVQNARISATGSPLKFLNYFIQVDFCAAGKIKFLDAFVTLLPTERLKLTLGQTRIPFSSAGSRIPRDYYFVNVSMIHPYGCPRAVGIKVTYDIPSSPLHAEGGIFNSSDMDMHTKWNSGMTYGVRLNALVAGWKPEVSFMSRIPGGSGSGVRVNMTNGSLSWSSSHWFVEGEYIYRVYTGNSHPATHIYSIFADYGHELQSRMFNRWSVQARFDGQNSAASGMFNEAHQITSNVPPRRRITVGATLSHRGPVRFDFRVNYEQYFYGESDVPHPDPSRLLAGAMLYF